MPKIGMEPVRKAQVVEATKQCVIDKGLSQLSVKDIASAAGVSTGIIYHYFENKEDILLKVIRQAFRKTYDHLSETVGPLDHPLDRLEKYIENVNFASIDNPEFFHLLLNYLGQAGSNPHISRILAGFQQEFTEYLEDLFRVGCDRGVFKGGDKKSISQIIVALGLGLGILRTLDPDSIDHEEIGKTFKELIGAYVVETGSDP